MYEKIPQELKDLDQWVCAYDDSKVPMRAWEYEAASSVDPESWSFFEQAQFAVENQYYDHIGFVFNNNNIVGIDIDIGYDNVAGGLTEEAWDIISTCCSYTERSKSGRGFHILLKGYLPFDGKNNLKGIEIYQAKRFFILTGDTMGNFPLSENQKAIEYVLRKYFQNAPESSISRNRPLVERIYSPIWKRPENGRVKLRPEYPDISSGSRNLSLASLAGYLHNTGYSIRDIYSELQYVNDTSCHPPLGDGEIRNIVNSITRYRR